MENPFVVYNVIQKMDPESIEIFDKDFKKIKSLTKAELKDIPYGHFLVFNGNIRQEMIDIASKKEYRTLIGKTLGFIDYFPENIEFYSFKKIEGLIKKKTIKIEVAGFDDPLTKKAREMTNKIKKDFGKLVSVRFIDLNKNNEYFEKYDISGVPAIIIDGELKFSGIPDENKIRSDIENKITGIKVIPKKKIEKTTEGEGWWCPYCNIWNEIERSICIKCARRRPKTGTLGEEEVEKLFSERNDLIDYIKTIESEEEESDVMNRLRKKKLEEIKEIEKRLRSLGENVESYRS
ncbi:MAG: hypothetical protein B5M53_00450 [Candidatus Cloacimonas sp. 4484_209]|nr:MAG: hypothetical protein B5M53_00450 [Candidatus Cloacimonas sp. 4484_209]